MPKKTNHPEYQAVGSGQALEDAGSSGGWGVEYEGLNGCSTDGRRTENPFQVSRDGAALCYGERRHQ